MFNFNVAVLMPTYARSEAIKDTLEACLDIYNKYNFDVYVFDSSGDDETKKIVYNLQENHKNLYYIRMCELIHLDCKWLDMIRGKYLKKKYDYIYPCGDSNSLTEFALDKIVPWLTKNVDLVNICDLAKINTTTEFHDPDSYFNSENCNIGQWAGAIYNFERIFNLSDKEWNIAIRKWFNKDFEYIGLNGFIFERLSLCNNLHIVEPSMDGEEPNIVMKRSLYKNGSFWTSDAIKLLGDTYPKVYSMLPACYTNCEEKVKKMIYNNFNIGYFCSLKKNYKFTLKEYFTFRKFFNSKGYKILNVKILLLAIMPKDFLLFLYYNKLFGKIVMHFINV